MNYMQHNSDGPLESVVHNLTNSAQKRRVAGAGAEAGE
jgi:hypothetical protein